MSPTTFLIILGIVSLLVVLVLALLSRHKKAGAGDVTLIGEIGTVDRQLTPEGTVLVAGELWPARSSDGDVITAHARVRVVGFDNHLALVSRCK